LLGDGLKNLNILDKLKKERMANETREKEKKKERRKRTRVKERNQSKCLRKGFYRLLKYKLRN
jgi:hypothetical protein